RPTRGSWSRTSRSLSRAAVVWASSVRVHPASLRSPAPLWACGVRRAAACAWMERHSISGHPKRWAGTSVICLIRRAARDLRTEVGKDLAEIRAKTSELVEKKVAAEDQLKRVDIRAMQLSGCTRSSNE